MLRWWYLLELVESFFFFFFQAEDGIRYSSVTGVQTCALPIYPELGADDQGPVIEPGANQLGAEGVGSRLECLGVRHPQKRVIVLRNSIPALRSCCSMK